MHFKDILDKIPSTVFALMRVSSIGPKKAYKLVKEFKFDNPDTVLLDLVKVAEEGKRESIPTFGKKSQEDILNAVNLYLKTKNSDDRIPLPYVYRLASDIISYMKQLPLTRIDASGSMRRMVSTIGDIDIAVATNV